MFPRFLTVTATLLLTTAVVSADQARQRWPDSSSPSNGGGGGGRQEGGGQQQGDSGGGSASPRTAAPRNEPRESPPPRAAAPPRESSPAREAPPRREAVRPPRTEPDRPASPAEPARPQGSPVRAAVGDQGARTAEPRQRWPGENSPSGNVAVPRESAPPYSRPGGGHVYGSSPRVYNNYYYAYPRRYYPYGYGSFGLGYFYYDPYAWYPYDHYNYRFQGYGYGYPTGEVRLQVRPRDAEVYVDGYFAGHVDEFDGFVQALRLEEGPYTLEIVAPGFETLHFNVRIQPGRKITYRGDMRPLRP